MPFVELSKDIFTDEELQTELERRGYEISDLTSNEKEFMDAVVSVRVLASLALNTHARDDLIEAFNSAFNAKL